MPMDTQELADLLYGQSQPGLGGVPADAVMQAANMMANPDAVSGVDSAGSPSQSAPLNADPYATQIDFTPKTYDFGNQGARNFEYDNQGNQVEVLPNGQKLKVKSGESGYSPEKMAQIEAGPMGSDKMAKKKQTAVDAIQSRYAPIKSGMEQANQEQLRTEEQLGQAESQAILARGEAENKVASIMMTHKSEMDKLAHDAILAKQKAADDYRAKLLEIQEVNPSALWDDAGPGGQAAMAAAAVIHEMLNVKGIKTSAMDTINNAIRNKIDSQIANINKQKAVASGFKDLYDMTVADSASAMEVKDKLHGYYLKAFEKQLDATLAPYDANVARVKRAQAKSVIRQAQLKNMTDVEGHIGREIDQAYGREITIRGQNIQASIAKANREASLEEARIRAKATEKPAAGPPIIYDTSTSGKGAARWRIKPQFADDKEMQRDLIKKTVLTNKAVNGFRELIELQKKIDGSPPAVAGRLRSELARREEALRSTVVSAIVLDTSGKAATDKEYDRIAATVPAQGWFTNGNNRKIISGRIKEKFNEMNDYLAQTTDSLKPGDPAYGTFATTDKYADAEGTEADMAVTGQDEHTPAPTDGLVKKARSPEALDVLIAPENKTEFEDFTKPLWQEYRKANPDGKVNNSVKGFGFDSNPTKGFDAVRELAQESLTNPEARADLDRIAGESPVADGSGSEFTVDANVRSYAKWFVERLNKRDPNPNFNNEALGY